VFGVFESLVMGGILLANLATGILLAHASVAVALIAVGFGFPVIALAGLPTLLRADRTSAPVAKRLRPRVRLLSALDLLVGTPRSTLERLAASAEEVVVPAGTVLIREGDRADALWILRRGELSVHALGDERTPRDLGVVRAPGYVGELGLLHGIPRTATVRAREQSTLLRIDGQEFLAALQAGRPSASLLSVAGARLARTPARIPQPKPPPGPSLTAL
jgi:CRP-like cAMP-binding protein